ncbi:histone-lysine N-methyltransferase SETDB1-A-like isoform X2 [Scomber scombrus]|uniref:Histone-lysine N-methyltransferase SETDB1-A-like isoform X2 n=1 Tax=Scomber scombrus TaxID=13677 RepID=A0AAV1MR82_SCOSC
MEEDEIEMTREELQMWIRDRVKKMELISPEVLNKCDLLQSLLIRKEVQVTNFLKLCESVRACEETVKKLYSVLQWEYRERDSGDDDNTAGSGNIPSSPCNSVHSETQVPRPPASPKRQDSANLNEDKCKKSCLGLQRKPVVVLTRLPRCKIDALRPPTPQNQYSEHESSCSHPTSSDVEWEPEDDSADSDNFIPSWTSNAKKRKKIEWEPEDDSADSDNSVPGWTSIANKKKKIELEQKDDSTDSNSTSSFTSITNKKRKMELEIKDESSDPDYSVSSTTMKEKKRRKNDKNSKKTAKSRTSTPQASANTDAKSNAVKTPTSANTDAKSNAVKTPTSANTDAKSNAVMTPTSANTDAKSNAVKTPTSANTDGKSNSGETSTPKGVSSVCIVSTLCQSSDKDTKVPPSVPQEKITVGMTVLARRKAVRWKCGKITEIVEREDGGMKYKVSFEDKGKMLVSGHHIAFQCVPKVTQLFIGARLVVKCPGDEPKFCPGVLAELPTRKNRMRFLVFLDDHTPIYVGLPLLHLVCRPLTDPLDDIPDGTHKYFMRDYMKAWPYPPQTQYSVGRTVNVELNGAQKKCEVVQIDSSLIQVVFQGLIITCCERVGSRENPL